VAVVLQRDIVAPSPASAKPPQEWRRRADNGPWTRTLIAFGVLSPIAVLVIAIAQLWRRAVYPVDVALLAGMYGLTAMGVTIGYHRYLTHRGFRAPAWLRALLLALGAMSMEGTPLTWASTHLEHHARADKEGDPHSPLQGFVHAHLGWIIDGFDANVEKYGSWLKLDPIVMFFTKTTWLWVLVSLAIPYAIDGWRGLVWGGFVRICLVHHVTWSVNSVCHVFGRRPFRTGDRSTNNWLVGLLAGGEGWHNNHHAFQRSAFHGLFWWQFDLAGLVIRGLELLHVIVDVQRVDPALLRARLREAASRDAAPTPSSTISARRAAPPAPATPPGR